MYSKSSHTPFIPIMAALTALLSGKGAARAQENSAARPSVPSATAISQGSIIVTTSSSDGKVTSGSWGISLQAGSVAIIAGSANTGVDSRRATGSGGVSVHALGPDGKSFTVHAGDVGGHPDGFSITGPDGKRLALSVHGHPTRREKVPYMGLMVNEAPEILSKHLPVPAGIGLVVMEVVKSSPAEKSGIQKDDVLLRFEDQLLANASQLRTLTRSKKPGDKVRLSLLQRGREIQTEVTVEEHEEDVAGPWKPMWTREGMPGWLSHVGERWLSTWAEKSKEMREGAPDLSDKARDVERTADRAAEAARRLFKASPGERPEAHRGPTTASGNDMQRRLDELEEQIGRLQAELNRNERNTPEKRDFRGRGSHGEASPEHRDGRHEAPPSRRNPNSPPPHPAKPE